MRDSRARRHRDTSEPLEIPTLGYIRPGSPSNWTPKAQPEQKKKNLLWISVSLSSHVVVLYIIFVCLASSTAHRIKLLVGQTVLGKRSDLYLSYVISIPLRGVSTELACSGDWGSRIKLLVGKAYCKRRRMLWSTLSGRLFLFFDSGGII